MNTDFSIWAFAYAHSSMPHDFFGGTVRNSNKGASKAPMVYSAFLGGAEGEAPVLSLVDTGMKGTWSPSGNPYPDLEQADTVLAKIGARPEEVERVILTHLHFDHMGNIDVFPNARFFVQKTEYEGWKRVLAEHGDTFGMEAGGWPLSSTYPPDFHIFDKLLEAGRVELLEGDCELAPGIRCHLAADSHTFGCQWVEVTTRSGPYVLAGDTVYWYENAEAMWPPAYVQGNCWNLLAAYREILATLDGEASRMVPGHDLEIFTRHPSWVVGMNEVAELHLAQGMESRRPADA